MDRSSPRLWQYLLFPNGAQSDKSLLLDSMVVLPTRLFMFSIPFILDHQNLNIKPAAVLNVLGWLIIYYSIGLTGIWLNFSGSFLMLLKWSRTGEAYVVIPKSAWICITAYFATLTVMGTTAMWMQLRSDGACCKFRALKIRHRVLEIITGQVVPILAVIGLVPIVLGNGLGVLLPMIMNIVMCVYITLAVRLYDEECRASPWRKFLLYVLTTVASMVFSFTGEYCMDLYDTWQKDYESDFWGRYFCRIRNEGGDLTYFKALVEEVFAREKERMIFDTAWLRKLYQHPVTGKVANPELWSRIKEYMLRVMSKDNPDLPWIRDQL